MMPDISWGIKILELINKPHIYWGEVLLRV